DLKRGVPRDGIYGVEQVLTVNTAAVRRIDQICIGSNTPGEMAFSHRTIVDGLRALKADAEKKEETPKTGETTRLNKLSLPGGQHVPGVGPFNPSPFVRPGGMGPFGPMPLGGGPAPAGGVAGAIPPASAPSADDQDVSIELVIYGEITLYNRYPPRQPAAERN